MKVLWDVNSKCGVQSKRKCESHESCICAAGFSACGCQNGGRVEGEACRIKEKWTNNTQLACFSKLTCNEPSSISASCVPPVGGVVALHAHGQHPQAFLRVRHVHGTSHAPIFPFTAGVHPKAVGDIGAQVKAIVPDWKSVNCDLAAHAYQLVSCL